MAYDTQPLDICTCNTCEAGNNKCFRFIPKVSFIWEDRSGSQASLNQFTPYYRLDYGPGTALALVKDFDNAFLDRHYY
jgi:hypothetical protein